MPKLPCCLAKIVTLLLGIVFLLLYTGTAFAQAQQPGPPRPAQSALSDPLAPPRPDPLRVAHDEAIWPFSFKDKSGYAGFELELWAKVAEGMGVEYRMLPMPFEEIIPALESGEVDIAIAAIPVTSARQERVVFSLPYYRTGLVGLCRAETGEAGELASENTENTASGQKPKKNEKGKSKPVRESFDAFTGKSVAVQRGSSAENFAKDNLLESNLKVYNYQEEIFFELLAYNVDIVFAELNLIEAYLNITNNPGLAVCSPVYSQHNLAIALPKESVHLNPLNSSLQAFRASSDFKDLCLKWFGTVPRFSK